MDQEQIFRYVMANDGFKDLGWYIDDSNSIEAGDLFTVDYRYEETRAFAKSVIQCTASHAPYPVNKTKSIIEIVKRSKAK